MCVHFLLSVFGAGLTTKVQSDAANLTFTDFTLHNNSGVFTIGQCTTFSGTVGDCNSSLFALRNLSFTNVRGTVSTSAVATLKCSAAAPCSNIDIQDVKLVQADGTAASGYLCRNVLTRIGFTCTS